MTEERRLAADQFKEEVRRLADIVQLASEVTQLRQEGSQLRGLSPVNQEKTPSFYVDPVKQVFVDYSGGDFQSGDVFALYQHIHGCTFREALYALAERYGVRPPDVDPAAFRRQLEAAARRRQLQELLAHAATYYHRALSDELRETALRGHYGLSDNSIDTFRVGYADGGLWAHLTGERGVSAELALATGLFVRLRDGQVVDFFQGRLVFPFWVQGRVGGMAGRRTERTPDQPWEQAKYRKLPRHGPKHPHVSELLGEVPFFNEDAARRASVLLITEGITDCIAADQAGYACISPATTRFRERDLPRLIERCRGAERVVLVNDSEDNGSGLKGAMATAEALHEAGVDVRVAELPREEGSAKLDLNEFLRDQGAAALAPIVEGAPRYLERLLLLIPADTDKAALEQPLRPLLEKVAQQSQLVQEHYVGLIKERFGLGLRLIRRLLSSAAPTPETPQDELFKGQVRVTGNRYTLLTEEGEDLAISSFRLEVLDRLMTDRGEAMTALAHTDRGEVVGPFTLAPSAWASRRSFIDTLSSPDLQWTGSDDNVQGVLRLLAQAEVETRQGTTVLGRHHTQDGPRWVLSDGLLGPDGLVEDADLVFLDTGAQLAPRLHGLRTSLPDPRELAARVLPTLLQLNRPEVMLPVVGWFFAAPFKPLVMEALGHFPILMVSGTQGSGKTTLLTQVMLPLAGYTRTEPFSATDTHFARIRLLSATASIPLVIDEYKPSDMTQRHLAELHRVLRRVYNGEVESRGRPDQRVNTYALSAPVCLSGEACPDDPALLDRFVSVSPNRNDLASHPLYREALRTLRALDLAALAQDYARFSLSIEAGPLIQEALRDTRALLARLPNGERASPRCQDNLAVVVFGLAMFGAYAQARGVKLPALAVPRALAAVIDAVMDGEEGGKSPLDRFVEGCSMLAHNRLLEEDRHYAVIQEADGTLLTCLHLATCYQLFLESRRKAGLPDETNGKGALRRLAKENLERGGYVVDLERRVLLDGKRPRLLALDLGRAGAALDVDPFPHGHPRGWGGVRGVEES
ncbi:MAG: DNA primase [Alphaproteobacteria bacterium]|nr:DNA primase [Alphaproteobacteria bacterium]